MRWIQVQGEVNSWVFQEHGGVERYSIKPHSNSGEFLLSKSSQEIYETNTGLVKTMAEWSSIGTADSIDEGKSIIESLTN